MSESFDAAETNRWFRRWQLKVLIGTMAGIAADPEHPGFRNIIMRPVPDRRLGPVTADYRTPRGIFRSAWRYEGDEWIWDFTIPEGSTATVVVPGEREERRYGAGRHQLRRVMR